MKKNPHLHLVNIAGTDFLCPDTCGVMHGLKNITLNPTARIFLELTENCSDEAELNEKAAKFFQITDPEGLLRLSCDIKQFLDSMKKTGAVTSENESGESHINPDQTEPLKTGSGSDKTALSDRTESSVKYFLIGGIHLYISSDDSCIDILKQLSDSLFRDFAAGETSDKTSEAKGNSDTSARSEPVSIILRSASGSCTLPQDEPRDILFENDELSVYETGSHIIIRYNDCDFPRIRHIEVSKEQNTVIAFINDAGSLSDTAEPCHELFLALRFPFLYIAARFGRFMLHSSSVLMPGKAYCFSASSGTGKSTHTEKLCRLYNATPVNGDLNLIGYDDQKKCFMVYGTPWCGTSGIADPHAYPLGGIFLLKRGDIPKIAELSAADKVLSVSNRMITPVLNRAQLIDKLSFIQRLSTDPDIDIVKIYATLNDESAVVSADRICQFNGQDPDPKD